MSTAIQIAKDFFRVLLYRNQGRDVLLQATLDGFHFPVISIPRHTRVAQQITTVVKRLWKLDTCCLFELPSSETQLRFQIAETRGPDTSPPLGMQWLPVSSLHCGSFMVTGEYGTIKASLAALEDYRAGRLPGVFGRLGWFHEVKEWVREEAAVAGLTLTGSFQQMNASPTFSLIRFETNGPALWFKAVGEPNLPEYSITRKLATAFPNFLPPVLASRPEWNAWLTAEAPGEELCDSSGLDRWSSAAESLALLQVSSFGRRFELIEAGCKDLRPCRLAPLVDPFLEAMTSVMRRQTSQRVEPLRTRNCTSLAATSRPLSANGNNQRSRMRWATSI